MAVELLVKPLSSDSGEGMTQIIPLFASSLSNGRAPSMAINALSRQGRSLARDAIAEGAFTAEPSTNFEIWTRHDQALLIGLGDHELGASACLKAGAKISGALEKRHGTSLSVRFTKYWTLDQITSFIEGMLIRNDRFDEYLKSEHKQKDLDNKPLIEHIDVFVQPRKVTELSRRLTEINHIVEAQHLARHLGNLPPNDLYPESFADMVSNWAKGKSKVSLEIIDHDKAIELGMGGIDAVGRGSHRKPCMVIIDLNPKGKNAPPVIVGKGITFDTGGISIKPSSGMEDMKFDMHGAATAFSTIVALEAIGHKERIVAILCLAENMPDGLAQRPGDIYTSYSGLTIEVLNTDAEGRLVLADGLWKAGEFDPSYIIDLATLTGSIVVALGHEATGMWTNDDDLGQALREAGEVTGEPIWPMPLFPAFEEQIRSSKVADVKNLGERWGGSNSAAAFLKQFVPERDDVQIPWAHLDIAGTAWDVKTPLVAHGATGVHVRTLVHHVRTA